MTNRSAMNHEFHNQGKFALLTFNNVYTNLPPDAFRLSDGTWVMPGVPIADLGIWKEWIGSIRMQRLENANLVLFAEEPSGNPEILDAVHQRLGDDLSRLFYMVHLHSGIECESADLLCGSSEKGVPGIRQMSQLATFQQSKGYSRAPITKEWLEGALALRAGLTAMEADRTQFRRVIRGLDTLYQGLLQVLGQDRLHQFVRSLEALILPDIGKTEKQFVHRCQTFARAGDDTRALLAEAFAMRSDTEHLNPWEKAVQSYPPDQREDVCLQRTRQIEHLACDAYSRLLHDAALRQHFQTETAITSFWELPDDQKRALWGDPLDIALEPIVRRYDQWERAIG